MSLTDSTYYSTPDCNLPAGTYATITEAIDRYERDILIQLLGYDLYKLVAAYSESSVQRVKDIVEGKEYTVGSHTVKWNGLLNDEKVSLLAFYVWINYVKDKSVSFTNVGVISASVEGGGTVSPASLIQSVGYKLRELAGYAGQDALAPSLFNFLLNHSSDYSEWVFNEFIPPNAFDI